MDNLHCIEIDFANNLVIDNRQAALTFMHIASLSRWTKICYFRAVDRSNKAVEHKIMLEKMVIVFVTTETGY